LIKKYFIIILAVFVVVAGGIMLLRESIVRNKVNSFCTSFHTKTGGNINIGKIQFKGLRVIEIENISLVSPLNDTLLYTDTFVVQLSLLKLIRLKNPVSNFSAHGIKIKIASGDSISNYSFLFRKSKSENTETLTAQSTQASKVFTLWNKLTDLSDLSFDLERCKITIIRNKETRNFYFPEIINHRGNCRFIAYSNDHLQTEKWQAGFKIDDDKNELSLTIKKLTGENWLPFFDVDNKPKIAYTAITLQIKQPSRKDTIFQVHAELDSLSVNYWRIAKDDVDFNKLSFSGICSFNNQQIETDSTANVTINKIHFKTKAAYDRKQPHRYALSLAFDESAADFFESLPKGIFYHFKDFKAKGRLKFDLNFALDMSAPDSLIFNSGLTGNQLTIEKYGDENFSRINNTFLFDAYDGDKLQRSFLIGPENSDFTPLNEICHYLQYAVLTSEDPSFFYHRGFIPDAFKESMIENIKAKRFVRGGSTISMQLVKNVFLSREKTISRKLQEMLIVWLIENKGLVSKERMFEIYLNAIEWGPGIYGIKEASQFYFSKLPSQLNLAESIFLASIIPRPKYYRYSFDEQGNLKPYLASYYKIVSNRMLSKTWISPIDTFNLQPQVKLKGPALKIVMPADSTITDSLQWNQSNELF